MKKPNLHLDSEGISGLEFFAVEGKIMLWNRPKGWTVYRRWLKIPLHKTIESVTCLHHGDFRKKVYVYLDAYGEAHLHPHMREQ